MYFLKITTFFSLLIYTSSAIPFLSTPQSVLIDEHDEDHFPLVLKTLKQASIIPTIVPPFEVKCGVFPTFSSPLKPVALGNRIEPSFTTSPPEVQIVCPTLNNTEGLLGVLTDPDAPSRKTPKWGEMCHWMFRVWPVNNSTSESCPQDLVPYKAPGPPEGTGYHRYIFFLLEGDNLNVTVPEERKHWDLPGDGRRGVHAWAEREGLTVIGANFFYAKYEE